MPATRKSSGIHAAPAPGKQSKLSFAHRVTKPSAARSAGKDHHLGVTESSPLPKQAAPERAPDPEAVDVSVEDDAVEQQHEAGGEAEYTTAAAPAPAPVRSAAEAEAEQVSDAQVGRYWRSLEAQRMAPRVHQEGLDMGEKVLRYFDVSSHYGPCIGISRIKRWNRAEKLGLRPPIEVLAVLLKEEKPDASRAHMDEIMNPSAGPDLS